MTRWRSGSCGRRQDRKGRQNADNKADDNHHDVVHVLPPALSIPRSAARHAEYGEFWAALSDANWSLLSADRVRFGPRAAARISPLVSLLVEVFMQTSGS